jgi:two-component sensor histidine kinase
MMKASRINFWTHSADHDQALAIGLLIRESVVTWLGLAPGSLGTRGGGYARRPNETPDKDAPSTHHLERRIEKLEAEIAHRQLLLEEVIHRTKNTLQLAVATLDEHIDVAGDAWVRRDLRNVQRQLRTLSRTHNRFYGPTDADGQSLSFRLSEICSSVFDSFGERSRRIGLSLAVCDIQLQRHQEISVSVILQELLTNAFPGRRQGTMAVNFDVDDQSICHLVVCDDGVGRRASYQASTGSALVEAFASGLRGHMDVASDHGTTVKVSFPLIARWDHAAMD